MARRVGPYAPLSASYASDDAIIEAGEKAELLYVRGLAFCATAESDGFLTEAQLIRFVGAGMKDAKARAKKLVEVGLWEAHEGGYLVRAWLKWNASAEELGRHRKKDRERKAAANAAPEPEQDSTLEGVPDSSDDSARNPEGLQTESGMESGTESNASRVGARVGDSLNFTTHNPPTPQRGKRGSRRAQRYTYDDDPDFGRFWDAFPMKSGKPAAYDAWRRAVNERRADPEVIIKAADRYRDDPARDPKKTKYPQGWLNDERYNDAAPEPPKANANAPFWEN